MKIDGGTSTAFSVRERSDVGHVRRWAAARCKEEGLPADDVGRVEVVVQEGLRNLIKYAGGGLFVGRRVGTDPQPCMEFLFLDQGPGMADFHRCLEDGFSSGGSAGEGLGSMRRLSDEFDAFTQVGKGTAILARFGRGACRRGSPGAPEWGAVCVPMKGEEFCGDTWCLHASGDRWSLLVADGLGHGIEAARASGKSCEQLSEETFERPMEQVFAQLDQALRPTRGAAVTLARWRSGGETCEIAGVGNVAATIVGNSRAKQALLHNGIVGHQLRKSAGTHPHFEPNGLLVCASDGIRGRWNLSDYPGLMGKDPGLVAGVLFRDFQRGRDDAAVVVLRFNKRRPA